MWAWATFVSIFTWLGVNLFTVMCLNMLQLQLPQIPRTKELNGLEIWKMARMQAFIFWIIYSISWNKTHQHRIWMRTCICILSLRSLAVFWLILTWSRSWANHKSSTDPQTQKKKLCDEDRCIVNHFLGSCPGTCWLHNLPWRCAVCPLVRPARFHLSLGWKIFVLIFMSLDWESIRTRRRDGDGATVK